ncbi:hypothetical protein N2152v2_011087 [Parachlorella kessleri]
MNKAFDKPENKTWEDCDSYDESQCGFQYSSGQQAAYCGIPTPSSWPALLQIASVGYRAHPWSPAAAFLYTGSDAVAAGELTRSMFTTPAPTADEIAEAQAWLQEGEEQGALYLSAMSMLGLTVGTWQQYPFITYLLEPAFIRSNTDDVAYNASLFLAVPDANDPAAAAAAALLTATVDNSSFGQAQGLPTFTPVTAESVYEPSSDDINRLLYCGYRQARCDGTTRIQQYSQAWDWRDTSADGKFDVVMWYNATGRFGDRGGAPPEIVRVNQGLNKAANAYIQWALGSNLTATLIGISDFPRVATKLTIDFSTLLGPLFITWLCQLLLPLMLVQLVYEKEKRLRTMMKMHGLGDAAYWAIQYAWFLAFNFVYTWVFIGFGSAINLSFFRRTEYSVQLVFYFLWNQCVVAFAFLLSTLFRSSRTAVVVTYMNVFGTGLVGLLLLEQFVSQGHWWVIFLELIPGFALYRGLYEIAQYSFRASYQDSTGLTWSNFGDPNNGMIGVMIIFAVEGVVFLLLAWYLEQVTNTGIGVPRHPLFFLGSRFSSTRSAARVTAKSKSVDDAVEVPVEAEDVRAERLRVEQLLQRASSLSVGPNAKDSTISSGDSGSEQLGVEQQPQLWEEGCSIMVQDLWKVFPPAGGNKEKVAVRGLSLAIRRGECFGLLGPNGAGKSTAINMLTGFLEPSAGSAWVEGLDIRNDMSRIYRLMGVCPQHDLLWETLTAREHLLFFGRLKGLQGSELTEAVDAALRSVNLFFGGVGDKRTSAFSGGMKRRLSVAISFMGKPRVVYLDEPSTGLDPASRHNLWDVVKEAKRDRGIILTTHSMEEAGVLCDRLGIFVDGQLVCIGAPRELTARHGGYYVFTITVPSEPEQEARAQALVLQLAPGARLTYALAGTRKYELPCSQVSLSAVFAGMEAATAEGLRVLDWGVANATLEEVFIKFAKSIGAEGGG